MELLFAVLGGIVCGLIAHVILPWRGTRGVLVGPVVGGIVAAVAWEVMTWAGWKYDGGWIWVISLVAAGVVALLVEWAVGPTRDHRDTEYFTRLQAAGRTAAGS